jgi:cobalt-zinc-cadmium efflux system outer membrane protein
MVTLGVVPTAGAQSLEALEASALAKHPAIQQAAARVEEARGRSVQAVAWNNPTVGVTGGELRPRETPSGAIGGFVEQTFMLGGKRDAARVAAGADVAVREAELAAIRQRVLVDVRTAYYEVLAAAEKVRVSERLLAVVDESVTIVRQLVNVGIAQRPDVLEAEAEAAQQKAMVVSARAHQAGAWRRLAAAVADPSMAAPTGTLTLTAVLPSLDRQGSLDQVLQQSPEVKAADAEVTRQRSMVEVERRSVSSDLTLRADAGWNRERLGSALTPRSLGWEFGAEAGITLPLWNKNRGGVMAARSSVLAAEAAAAHVRLELDARFSIVFEEYERARAMADAYRADILPRLEQAFDLHLGTYRSMATPYPQVLTAQRRLVEANEQYVDALDRAWQAAVRIQGLVAGR